MKSLFVSNMVKSGSIHFYIDNGKMKVQTPQNLISMHPDDVAKLRDALNEALSCVSEYSLS